LPKLRVWRQTKVLFEKALADMKWQGTGAVADCASYWTEGVLATSGGRKRITRSEILRITQELQANPEILRE